MTDAVSLTTMKYVNGRRVPVTENMWEFDQTPGNTETMRKAMEEGLYLAYVDGKLVTVDRNVWCARCGNRTDNTTQGHYWAFCKATRTDRDFHFCCPDACELEDGALFSKKGVVAG